MSMSCVIVKIGAAVTKGHLSAVNTMLCAPHWAALTPLKRAEVQLNEPDIFYHRSVPWRPRLTDRRHVRGVDAEATTGHQHSSTRGRRAVQRRSGYRNPRLAEGVRLQRLPAEKWGLKNGFKMKKPAMFAPDAAIKFTGAL